MLYDNHNKKNADKPKILAHPHNANQIIFMNIEVYKILQKKIWANHTKLSYNGPLFGELPYLLHN